MKVKNVLLKIMPTIIKSVLKANKRKKEKKDLNLMNKIDCDTSALLSANKVDLSKIFNSEKIQSSWIQTKKEIDFFNIPDNAEGVNPGDRRAIYFLIRYFKPNSVLEIGTHIGASTVHIALAIRKNQLEDKTKPYLKTLDIKDVNSISEKPWLQYGIKKSPFEMIRNLQCETFVEFLTDTSLNYFETNDEKFDFIFLDGDHSAKTVYKEIPLALKKLNKGGIILLHDYFPNGKPLWVNKSTILGPYLATERHIANGAPISIMPLGNLPWPTKLNSNTTSLALLLKKS